jgi:hypothetical protein
MKHFESFWRRLIRTKHFESSCNQHYYIVLYWRKLVRKRENRFRDERTYYSLCLISSYRCMLIQKIWFILISNKTDLVISSDMNFDTVLYELWIQINISQENERWLLANQWRLFQFKKRRDWRWCRSRR